MAKEVEKVVSDDVKDHYESQVRIANYLLVRPRSRTRALLGRSESIPHYTSTRA